MERFSVLLSVMLAGCLIAPEPDGSVSVWPYPCPILLDAAHRCTFDCPHYLYEGRWYAAYGHRHGAGCGHCWTGRFRSVSYGYSWRFRGSR